MSFGLDMALLANGYKGYQQGKDAELERQHTVDKNAMDKERWEQEKEDFKLKREESERARAERRGIGEASKVGDITEEAETPQATPTVTPTATDPAVSAAPLPVDQSTPAPAPQAPAVQAAAPTATSAGRFKVGGLYFKTRAEAEAASTDAVNSATIKAMRANGNIKGALDFQRAIRDDQTSGMAYKKAVQADKDDQFNRAFDDEISKAGGDTFGAMANILTNTNMHGMEGIKVEARKSADGKTVSMVAVGPQGEKEVASYPNTTAGQLAVRQRFMKSDPATRTAWLKEKAAEEKDLANTTWTRGFQERELNMHETTANAQLANAKAQLAISGGHLQLAKAEESRKAAAWTQEQKIPVAVKTKYAALESSAKILDTEMTRAQVNGSWDPSTPAGQALIDKRTSINTQMSTLLDPYVDQANEKSKVEKPAADPLGFNGAAPAAPAPKAPASPAKPKMSAADMKKQASGLPK
jgi:hypothetical protein